MKHLVNLIQESLFDKDLVSKHLPILYEITLSYFEKMMNSTTVDEWHKLIVELDKYLKKVKADNISFKEYTDKNTYKDYVMTIVPLIDDKNKGNSSVVISFDKGFVYRTCEIRTGVVGDKLFPDCYFWSMSIPSSKSLPQGLLTSINKAGSQKHIYKITFSETDMELFMQFKNKKRK